MTFFGRWIRITVRLDIWVFLGHRGRTFFPSLFYYLFFVGDQGNRTILVKGML